MMLKNDQNNSLEGKKFNKKQKIIALLLQFIGLGLPFLKTQNWSKWLYMVFLIVVSIPTILYGSDLLLKILFYPFVIPTININHFLYFEHILGLFYWTGFIDIMLVLKRKNLYKIRQYVGTGLISLILLQYVVQDYYVYMGSDIIYVFEQNFILIKKNEKYGFIDKMGKIIIPLQYDEVNWSLNGLISTKKNGKWGLMDKTRKIMIPSEYDQELCFDKDSLIKVKKNEKWGLIDKTGKNIIPIDYDYIGIFSEGFTGVKKNGKWGFIDKTGKIIIPFEYDYVGSFSQGLAYIKKNEKWFYINRRFK